MNILSLTRSFTPIGMVLEYFITSVKTWILFYILLWNMNIISRTRSFAPNWHGIRIFDNQYENGTFVRPSLLHNFPIHGFL